MISFVSVGNILMLSAASLFIQLIVTQLKCSSQPGMSAYICICRSERRLWLCILFSVCAVVYATRAIMPLCIVAVSHKYHWSKTEMVTATLLFHVLSKAFELAEDRWFVQTTAAAEDCGWMLCDLMVMAVWEYFCKSFMFILKRNMFTADSENLVQALVNVET